MGTTTNRYLQKSCRGEMEDQALEEDRHDNELTVVEALGSRGRSTDL